MASRLMLPIENPLHSHMNELQQMEIQTINLINQCSSLQKTKQYLITNAKLQINTQFENIITKLKTKQNDFLMKLDTINHDIHSEQSIISSITTIINQQKQYLHSQPTQTNQTNNNFNKSKQLYLSHVKSIRNALSSNQHNQQISQIITSAQQYINSFQTSPKQIISNTKNNTISTQSKQTIPKNNSNKSLLNSSVYNRLQSSIIPRNSFYYQYVSKPFIPYVLSINILTEFLPNKIIKILFNYLPKIKQFNISNYLKNGWEVCHSTLHDYPNIYIENILPLQNQPSLIITIGLPGSGKTSWAKIRNYKSMHTIVAADDYFDKFNAGNFNVSLLSKAHEWTQQNVFNALKAGYNVVVNNTNTTLPEMHTYITRIIFGSFPHKIVFAIMPEMNVNTLIKRGVHKVPYKQIVNMLKRFKLWYKKYPPSVKAIFKAGEFKRKEKKNYCTEVLYTGVFMSRDVQNKIRKYFINISGSPLLCNSTDCHLTLKFRPLVSDVNRLPFGKKVRVKLIGYAVHEYVQTFLVDIMDDFVRGLCSNKYAHITVGFDENFVRPNYSNYLLEYGRVVPVVNNFDVVNSKGYDELYRNVKKISGGNGGLIVEGIIGAVFKGDKKNSGLKFVKPDKMKQREMGGFYKPQPNNSSRFRR